MHCCGDVWSRRDWMWSTLLTTSAAMFAGCAGTRSDTPAAAASAEPYAAAARVLREHVSIDVHTHAGPNGVTSRTALPSDALARSMRAGGIAVLCLADVPDGPILGRDASNVLRALREPEPGFLYRYHQERLDWLDTLTAKHGIRRVLTVADLGRPTRGRARHHPGHRGSGLPRAEARAARGVVPARRADHAARPLHPERHRRLPDRHRRRTAASPRSGPTSSARATGWASSSTWRTPPRTP